MKCIKIALLFSCGGFFYGVYANSVGNIKDTAAKIYEVHGKRTGIIATLVTPKIHELCVDQVAEIGNISKETANKVFSGARAGYLFSSGFNPARYELGMEQRGMTDSFMAGRPSDISQATVDSTDVAMILTGVLCACAVKTETGQKIIQKLQSLYGKTKDQEMQDLQKMLTQHVLINDQKQRDEIASYIIAYEKNKKDSMSWTEELAIGFATSIIGKYIVFPGLKLLSATLPPLLISLVMS